MDSRTLGKPWRDGWTCVRVDAGRALFPIGSSPLSCSSATGELWGLGERAGTRKKGGANNARLGVKDTEEEQRLGNAGRITIAAWQALHEPAQACYNSERAAFWHICI